MGAQKSRLAKAGGNAELAAQMLADEFAAGARGWSQAEIAAYTNPATRDAWIARKIGQSTKGKYSGVLGKVAKVAKTVAPLGAAFIPGVGPLAAAGIAAGTKAAGQALSGEPINVGQAALAGVGAYGLNQRAGRAPLSSGSGFTPPNPGGLRGVDAVLPVTDAVSDSGGGGSFLGRVGGGVLDFIKSDPERALRLGLGGIGAIQASQAAGRANDLQRRALAPLYGGGVNPYADLPTDEGNPYARNYRRPQGQAALMRELSR